MKWLRTSLLTLSTLLFCLTGQSVSALKTTPYQPSPQLPDSPIIITGYSLLSGKPGYIQLFNSSPKPINLEGWRVQLAIAQQSEPVTIMELAGWIAPSNYLMVADEMSVAGTDFQYSLNAIGPMTPTTLRIHPSSESMFQVHDVGLSKEGLFQRKVSASTGNYLSTFDVITNPILYGGGFYSYPLTTAAKISEILANPRTCPPTETAQDCEDYVKLYNPSSTPIDLSVFRLRIGYKGQSSSPSNTYLLEGVIQPGHYKTLVVSADDREISITNTGGFIWLEDTYGVMRYDQTVQAYEDASSVTKKGYAWAYDENQGKWKWTSQPTPGDRASVFPVQPTAVTISRMKTHKPCKNDQYRSRETNRCRSLASLTTSTLKSCTAGQYRNPATNRCRNVASAANSLKPCAVGQERNPETNRCRKVASGVPGSSFPVATAADASKAFAGWWALGGIGILAVGYGIWEWRHDIATNIRKFGTFFTSGK